MTGGIIALIDADGQHDPKAIHRLFELLENGFNAAVGARSSTSQTSLFRLVANRLYKGLASLMTGFQIQDLTSGFRAVKKKKLLLIHYLSLDKLSYPTNSTVAFFRSNYFLGYVPIEEGNKAGQSHIKLFWGGVRYPNNSENWSLYSFMRLFLPISASLFAVVAVYNLYTFITDGRFTNMGMLLYVTALSIFLIGIVVDHIFALHYSDSARDLD